MEYQPYFDVDNLLAAIAHRRSMGLARLKADPVAPHLIEKLLEAANWAPSHDETEPWRFSIFTGDHRKALGDVFGEAYRMEATGEKFKESVFEAQRDKVWKAPVWISIGMTPAVDAEGVPQVSLDEEMMAVACAVQNLHLMASAIGVAGMWNSKFPLCHPHVAQFVGLTPPSRLLGFFFLGWPNIPWPQGERRPIAEKVRWPGRD